MKDRRKKWLIKLCLKVLRWAGQGPQKVETPQEVTTRRMSYLEELKESGYEVKHLTPYHIRVNGQLDLYPVNARFHDIKRNVRGGFYGQNLASFVRKYFQEI